MTLPNRLSSAQGIGFPRTAGGLPMSSEFVPVPFTQTPHYKVERIRAEGYVQFRSALLTANMAQAAYAGDPLAMLSSTLALREFIVTRFNVHFQCDSAEVLEELDAHVARLRRVIAERERRVS